MLGSWGKKNILVVYYFIESVLIVLSECIYWIFYEYFKFFYFIYRWNYCNYYNYIIYKRVKYIFYCCIKEVVLDNLVIIKNKFLV